MQEHCIFFATDEFYQLIRNIGGTWTDSKDRPLLLLTKSNESPNLFWAIPMGNMKHRDLKAQSRIQTYLSHDISDIRSCFYHIGKTDTQSIFFLSDAIPITSKYINKTYLNKYTNKPHIIKNPKLLSEIEQKLKRILFWEAKHPNYFRQHITTLKNYLLNELKENNV